MDSEKLKIEKIRNEINESEKTRIEININHALKGVVFLDIKTAYIDNEVKIGEGTKIYPNVIIEGDTFIGEDSIIGTNSHIKDSKIGRNVLIRNSVIEESEIGNGTTVGPFAYLRPNCKVGENCKIGDFVEVKNSNIGNGSKASHLTYVGDSDVGENVNLGCGVVFVNYDGTNKFRSKVEDGAFVGCNVNLVSPVNIGKNGYIAAGSTVTKDVPEDSLFIAREEPRIIPEWVKHKKRK